MEFTEDQPARRGAVFVRLLTITLAMAGISACGQRSSQQAQTPSAQTPPPSSSQPILAPENAPFTPTAAQAILQTLTQAPGQGFAPGAFGDPGQIASLIASADPAGQAQGQRRLRAAILKYARAQHGLGLPTDQFPKEWGIRPARYDADLDLRAAQGSGRVAQWLASLPPPDPRYQALVKALAAYRAIAAKGGWPSLPAEGQLGPGAHGRRVTALRDRLAVEDPGAAAAAPDGSFDDALGQAVARFQANHQLEGAGKVGPKTWQALNVPVQDRIDQIRANLERWRWLPRVLPAARIEVDAASDTMDAYQGGRDVQHMLAAAGKPDDQTPMLISKITDIEFNPPWRIPADIASKELFPKERRDHGYFKRNDIIKGPSAAVPLVQKAGPKSALGQVKFEFDNAYGVYLHDTPAKQAFQLNEREVSHGCVRLQRALDLAKTLLNGVPGWSPQRVDQTVAGNNPAAVAQAKASSRDGQDDQTTPFVTQRVSLPQPVPVMILYWTAYVQNGQVVFGLDPYGWDDILVRLLDAASSGQA